MRYIDKTVWKLSASNGSVNVLSTYQNQNYLLTSVIFCCWLYPL